MTRRGCPWFHQAGGGWFGEATGSDAESVAGLPDSAIALIEASIDLHARVRRLEGDVPDLPQTVSPALSLLDRLERAF